jgi:hypothetical protein
VVKKEDREKKSERKREKRKKKRRKKNQISPDNATKSYARILLPSVHLKIAPRNQPNRFVTIGTEYSSLHQHHIVQRVALIKPSTFASAKRILPIRHSGQVKEIRDCKLSL